MGFDPAALDGWWQVLAAGTGWTLGLSLMAGALSLVLGPLLAVMAMARGWTGRGARGLLAVLLGTPLLVQILALYFGLAQLGLALPPVPAGVAALGLHYAAHHAEALRAAIAALPPGQTEAAAALGLSRRQRLRLVILPQALRLARLPVGGNLIALIKDSSLLSFIGIAELLQAAQRGIAETFRPLEFYLAAGLIYYAISLTLELALARWARPCAGRAARPSPARP